MKIFTLLFLLTTLTVISNFAQAPPIEPGVSQKLAQWRAANYSDVRYKLNITLEKGAPLMKGNLEIRVDLTDEGAKNDLILDWRTTPFANDKDKPYAVVMRLNEWVPSDGMDALTNIVSEHLVLSRKFLKAGENFIKINFASPIKTSGAAITRYVDREDGAEYIYSLFVPSDASTAFPVFDQPDLKARFELELKTPIEWNVISNTRKFSVNQLVSFETTTKDWRKISSFVETKPISTYVFAFAAGDFESFAEKPDAQVIKEIIWEKEREEGIILKEDYYKFATDAEVRERNPYIYVRKSQAEKFKQHAAEVFRLNREGVKYLESYFDFKFPFPKYDLVLIPEFPFRGMEHAGATFLREDSIIFPSEPTANDHISRANVIFHEAAHQWFGDTVTMKWFDDLWLKEGFAEFMAYKTLENCMPEYNAWKAFYERNKPLAYATDSTRGTTPIYQEIPNLSAAKSAYGNIVYRKAPSFLRQAEFYLGEDKFQIAVRAFLKKHQFANAGWTDLVEEFETVSKENLKDWASVWVKQRGIPKVKYSEMGRSYTESGLSYSEGIAFTQSNILNESGYWWMKIKIFLLSKDGKREIKTLAFEHDSHFDPLEVNLENSVFIFPNYQDYGYGIFLLDAKSRAYILKNIQNEKDDFLRSMMWGSLWDSVREAELAPKDYVELAIKNISVEKDELTIQTILARVSTAMSYYISDAQANELAPPLENLLINKMQTAPSLGQRITFYRAFLNLASSEKARTVLKELLKGAGGNASVNERAENEKSTRSLTVAFLPLKTKDKFDIVARLAILGDADAAKLLDELQKTETSDDAKRYAYAVGAAFPTKEAKEKYFNDFLNNKEISESWIESAFVPFNSSRHSALTLPFLEKALAELPNLKRNRKIFFVNGWLAAFIGGQKDEKALAIVNKFLADNPDLDKDLRLKILENLDVIERSVKIRSKFGKN